MGRRCFDFVFSRKFPYGYLVTTSLWLQTSLSERISYFCYQLGLAKIHRDLKLFSYVNHKLWREIHSQNVTGGVYKAYSRYSPWHADPRLLAIPTSCRRIAAYNPD